MAKLPKHVVRGNEDLEKFAAANHYKNFRTIWLHPKNRDLRKKRGDPENIQKGDVIVLPVPDRVKENAEQILMNWHEVRLGLLNQRMTLQHEIIELKTRNRHILDAILQCRNIVKAEAERLEKLLDQTLERKQAVDMVGTVVSLHKGVLKVAGKQVRRKFLRKKGVENLRKLYGKDAVKRIAKLRKSKAMRDFLPKGGTKALEADEALEIARRIHKDGQTLVFQAVAKSADTDTTIGAALDTADKAMTLTHNLWFATKGLSGEGWDYQSTVKRDAQVKIRELKETANGFISRMEAAVKHHMELIADYEARIAAIDRHVEQIDKRTRWFAEVVKM